MANFVEQATLRVVDKSTAPLRKINKEMLKVLGTGKKLGKLTVSVKGMPKATRDVSKLNDLLRRVPRSKSTSIRVTGAAKATGAINKHQTALAKIPKVKSSRLTAVRTIRDRFVGGAGATPKSGVRNVKVNVSSTGLRNLLQSSGTWSRMAMSIERAVIAGFTQGAAAQDIGDTRLALLGLTKGERATTETIVSKLANEFKSFTKGELRQTSAEVIPVVRDAGAAGQEFLMRRLLKFAEIQIASGGDRKQAIDRAFLLSKAGESSGNFTDAATGKFDETKVADYFDSILRAQIIAGKEITPELVRSLTKSLRTSKFGLSKRGFITALISAEEEGSTAGVGINQSIKQLAGERVRKKQRAFAAELGLIKTKEITTGSVGGKKVTETVADGTVDEELLRKSPSAWVQKYVIPKMVERGLDPTNAVDAAKFAGKLTSDRTATDALAKFILRGKELADTVDRALALDVKDKTVESVMQDSLLLALTEVQGSFSDVMGEAARSLEGVFLPALNAVSDGLSGLASFITGSSNDDETGSGGSAARTGLIGLGGAAAAGLLGKTVMKVFGKAGLAGSAVALTGSAGALDVSAAALLAAAKAQGAGGGLGGGKGGSKAKPKGGLRTALGKAGPYAGAAAIASAGYALSTAKFILPKLLSAPVAGVAALVTPDKASAATLPEGKKLAFNKASAPTDKAADAIIATAKIVAMKEANKPYADAVSNIPAGAVGARATMMRSTDSNNRADILAAEEALVGSTSPMQEAFGTGSETVKQGIDEAAMQFGPVVAQQLLAMAPAFGQSIGAAVKGAIGDLNVKVNSNNATGSQATPALDTGASATF